MSSCHLEFSSSKANPKKLGAISALRLLVCVALKIRGCTIIMLFSSQDDLSKLSVNSLIRHVTSLGAD